MKVKVRTHPIDVYYLTGSDASAARLAAEGGGDDGEGPGVGGGGPCFATGSLGGDGFVWETPEEFEADYRVIFGGLPTPTEWHAESVAAGEMRAKMEEMMEFWDNGTPVHPGAEVVGEARELVRKAKGGA